MQAGGIAAAVGVFVVAFDGFFQPLSVGNCAENFATQLRMYFQELEFFFGERATLIQYSLRNKNFADVVDPPGKA